MAVGADRQTLAIAEILLRSATDMAVARADFARLLAKHPADLDHFQRGSIFAALGKRDAALDEMEESLAAREPDLVSMQWDPAFDTMRSDPRYRRIIRAMGLPPS